MALVPRRLAATFGLAASVFAAAASVAGAFEHYEAEYGLSVTPSTLTIESADGMVHICGEPMFEAGLMEYSISDDMLNLRHQGSDGIDFDHMSGKKDDIFGSWAAVDDGLSVVLHVNESSLKVVSDCE